MDQKLISLFSQCENSVHIDYNEHKGVYASIRNYLEEYNANEELEKEIYEEIINRDTVIKIQFYPRTSVGFYLVYHYDIDKALDQCLEILTKVLD